MIEPKWLSWARKLNAIARNGLTYSENPYDWERYEQIRQIAGEILAEYTEADATHFINMLSKEKGYTTPKIDVRGVVFNDEGKILLVKERSDGGWTLPGGWADVNESPAENVIKEIREEAGFEAKTVKLLAVWDKNAHEHPPSLFYTYKLFFLCEITGGEAKTSLETSGVDFFAEDNIPPLSMDRTTPGQLRRLFEHYRNPDLPTDFD